MVLHIFRELHVKRNVTVTYGSITIVDGERSVTMVQKDGIDQDAMTVPREKFERMLEKFFTDNF